MLIYIVQTNSFIISQLKYNAYLRFWSNSNFNKCGTLLQYKNYKLLVSSSGIQNFKEKFNKVSFLCITAEIVNLMIFICNFLAKFQDKGNSN